MKSGLIYRLEFPNGKNYIGLTTGRLPIRLKSHRCQSALEYPVYAVHRAWKKYGEPIVSVIAHAGAYALPQAERLAISAFASFGPNGYNMTPGGDESPMLTPSVAAKVRDYQLSPEGAAKRNKVHVGSKRSPETRERLSKMRKGQGLGIPKSEEHRRKISLANKGKQTFLGRKHSEETKRKMSESAILRWEKYHGS